MVVVRLIALPRQKYYHPGEIHPCNVLIVDNNGNPVTGQKPTIDITRMSDYKYLDFSTGKFVSSGGQRYKVLTEIGDGLYGWNFDQDKYEGPNVEETYKIVYENKGKYQGVTFEEVVYKWPEPIGSEGIFDESQID